MEIKKQYYVELSYWARLGADFLDLLVLYLPLFFSLLYFEKIENIYIKILIIIFFLILVIYNIYLYFAKGQSIIYKLAGMKIVKKSNYKKPSRREFILMMTWRYMIFLLFYINIILGLILVSFVDWLSTEKEKNDIAITVIISKKRSYIWTMIFMSVLITFILFAAYDYINSNFDIEIILNLISLF